MFQLMWLAIVGYVVGRIAGGLVPGSQHMTVWATTFLGLVGAIVGGMISATILRPRDETPLHPGDFLFSVLGAALTLVVWHRIQ